MTLAEKILKTEASSSEHLLKKFKLSPEKLKVVQFRRDRFPAILLSVPSILIMLILLYVLFFKSDLQSILIACIGIVIVILVAYRIKKNAGLKKIQAETELVLTNELIMVSNALIKTSKMYHQIDKIEIVREKTGDIYSLVIIGNEFQSSMYIAGFEDLAQVVNILKSKTKAQFTEKTVTSTKKLISLTILFWLLSAVIILFSANKFLI